MLTPALPPYDLAVWRSLPFPERLKAVCQAWAVQGYGSPWGVYLLYLAKIAAYMGIWALFCTATPGNTLANIGTWWASDVAFQKAILWTMLFEGLGLGCGSGPLTGRYLPPIGGALYFLRPGTTKLPILPIGNRRTWLDVLLYAAVVAALSWALVAPAITPGHLVPILVLVPVLGLLDKTLFLAFRSEHYLSVLVCLLFADWISGSKVVWMAIWWWAATSKLNAHFPAVLAVMVSNSPLVPVALKRWMYRSFPDDLRPSLTAARLAHAGTALEYAFPLVLLLGQGGPVTSAALVVATVFHLFILSQVPMGVPLEWNVIMIYGAAVLFGVHADVAAWSIHAPALWLWLLSFHLVLPVYGSLFPDRVSFLLSMRYYAGNWAGSVWLFRGDALASLDRHLTKSAPGIAAQLAVLYPPHVIEALMSKVMAFRAMHLHGRAYTHLASTAVHDLDAYQWVDGELVAGLVLGWNFGDGHLHSEQLLAAVQDQCHFAPGEVRVVMIESQPIHRPTLDWRIADAHGGVLQRGTLQVAELSAQQPWPT